MQNRREAPRRTIANYTSPRSFEPRTRAALRGLGYNLVPASVRGRFDDTGWKPDLRIIDEQHLKRLPSRTIDPHTPIITVVGGRPRDSEDPRIAGRLQRPLGLVPLFQLIQATLEINPREVPRAPTQLPARCLQTDRRWNAAVVSLSERGCLLRSTEPVEIGARLNLQFSVPQLGLVTTRARCVNRESGNSGLAFSAAPEGAFEAIRDFVVQRLATL